MYFVYYNDRHPPAEKPSCKIRHTHSSCAQTLDYLIKHLDSPLLDESARHCPCRPRHKSLESSELFRCSIFQRLSQSSLNISSLRNFDGRICWSLCELGVSSENAVFGICILRPSEKKFAKLFFMLTWSMLQMP